MTATNITAGLLNLWFFILFFLFLPKISRQLLFVPLQLLRLERRVELRGKNDGHHVFLLRLVAYRPLCLIFAFGFLTPAAATWLKLF